MSQLFESDLIKLDRPINNFFITNVSIFSTDEIIGDHTVNSEFGEDSHTITLH